MPGLVPGIHVLTHNSEKDVDGRDKPGHDENWSTAASGSPRRRTLHRRLAFRIRGPQFHALIVVAGIDGELAAFEQRLQAAIAEFLRRHAAVQLRRQLHDKSRLKGPMK